jgi:uncharacterized protein (TIGR00730 family)
MNRICVFCGSNFGFREQYADAARALGRALVDRGLGLVYGGGCVGLMGTIADAVMKAGGEVVGVIPDALVERELAHGDVSKLIVVRSMHERKAKMAELADAFIAMPGGFGTFEEFCEILTWAQLGLHRKPCGILNVDGYYDPLLALFDHAVSEGFLRPGNRLLVVQETDPHRLLDTLMNYIPPQTEKWIGRDDS